MKRLKELEESFESGSISEDEYEKKKKEIESMPEKMREKTEEIDERETKLKSDKMLIIGVALILLVFFAFFGLRYFTQEERPQTIEELHELNLKGKLNPEQGYLYNGIHSFVKVDDVWYTQLKSHTGRTLYDFNFRYAPRELEDISIKGNLDTKKFNNATQYYATFNPLGSDFTYVRLARLDYATQMIKVFQKTPISACDRNVTNETTACVGIPIITCENTEDIVVYFNESDELSVEYKGNCIVINGRGFDLVKGVDRVLYNLYGIMA